MKMEPCPECGGDGCSTELAVGVGMDGNLQAGYLECSFCDGQGYVMVSEHNADCIMQSDQSAQKGEASESESR